MATGEDRFETTVARGGVACLYALLVTVPVFPFHFLFLDAVNPYLLLGLRYLPVLVCALYLCTVILTWRPARDGPAAVQATTYLVLGHLVVAILSSLGSMKPTHSLAKTMEFFASGEMLLAAIALMSYSNRRCERLISAGLVSVGLVILVGMVERLAGIELYEALFAGENPYFSRLAHQGTGEGRAHSTIGNPLALGAYLCIWAPMVLMRCFRSCTKRGMAQYAALFAGLVVVVYHTFSRSAWLGLLVGSLMFLWGRRRSWMLLAALIACLGIWLGSDCDRIGGTYSEVVIGFRDYYRVQSWGWVMELWAEKPVLGHGIGIYRFAVDTVLDTPDNMCLTTLVETGIVGLAFQVLVIAAVLRGLVLEFRKENGELAANNLPGAVGGGVDGREMVRRGELFWTCVASVTGCCVNMVAWDFLYFPATRTVFWVFAGVVLSSLGGEGHCREAGRQARWRQDA